MPSKVSEPANKLPEDPAEWCRRLIQSWWPEAADDESSNPGAGEESSSRGFCIGGDEGVTVAFGPDAVEIYHETVYWDGPHSPIEGIKLWRRLSYEELQEDDLYSLIKKGIQSRKRQFRKCRY